MKLKKITQEELKEVLELHKKWLNGEENGVRADLSYMDLRDMDLRDTNLRHAKLRYANLEDANLQGANLRGTNLEGVVLQGAKLSQANLTGVFGLKSFSIDNVGTFHGKVTYIPSLNTVFAGCWTGNEKEFFDRCKVVEKENKGRELNLDFAVFMVKKAMRRNKNKMVIL